jgi:ribose transport system substrate-binding protein
MKQHILGGVITALILAGCSGSNSSTPAGDPDSGGDAAAPGKIEVAFVPNNASDFWTIAQAGTEKAEEDLDVVVHFRIPSAGTAEQQQQIVQDLITTGVSGIAISPKDPANQTEMLNNAAAQVNLITQDSDAPDSDRLCYVGTDNFAAGKAAGKLINECMPDGGKVIACVGTMDAQNARDRLEGLKEEIAGTGIEVVDVRTDETDRAKAIANVEDALISQPEVTCFVGLWSYNAPAILNAVKSAGKTGEVKIVAFDEEPETLQGVKDGHIFGTVVQQPYEFGYQSVKVLKALAEGDQSVIPESEQIIVPVLSLKQDNVDAFWEELNARLGRS